MKIDYRKSGSFIGKLYISNGMKEIDYRISLNLWNITSNKLKGSFKYFCRMFTKICPVNHVSSVLLSLSVVELLQNGFLYLALS